MPRTSQFTSGPSASSACWRLPAPWLDALPARHRAEVEAALAALVACDRQAAHVQGRLLPGQRRRVDRRAFRRLVAEADALRTAAFNAISGLTVAAALAASDDPFHEPPLPPLRKTNPRTSGTSNVAAAAWAAAEQPPSEPAPSLLSVTFPDDYTARDGFADSLSHDADRFEAALLDLGT